MLLELNPDILIIIKFLLTWPDDGFCTGCFFDDISSNGDVAANTFKITLNINNIVDNFEYYQIGVVCASKKYTKSWRTSDVELLRMKLQVGIVKIIF